MDNTGVIIIGAGASGLSAALTLASAGRQVTLLEGRERIGGRIHTATTKVGSLPIELGAEFIHGSQHDMWSIIRSAGLVTYEVPDRHWKQHHGQLQETPFWPELQSVLGHLKQSAFDEPFASFMEHKAGLEPSALALARQYIEGFHAAEAQRIGVRAVQQADHAVASNNGTAQFRVTQGYSGLTDWFRDQLAKHQVQVHCRTVVKRVTWEPGRVEVAAETPDGVCSFEGLAALITLPLGVLQHQGPAGITFVPPVNEKQEAIEGLAVGAVLKVTLHFSSRFWPVDNFGFIHLTDSAFPTWWSDERGNLLTAWAGGAQALKLAAAGTHGALPQAIEEAGRVFNKPTTEITELLLGGYTYDWVEDPFSCGAYSYTPAGMMEMPELLAAPVAGTLFFAGEATDSHGNQGTVHGAIASGNRAAHEILDTV